MQSKKEKEFERINKDALSCKKCILYKKRISPVIGQGSLKAKIMFIGEAPGAKEDATGIPFCGRSGKFLDELLSSAQIDRQKVYICNIIKCRPPENRDPGEKEIKACSHFIEKQIEVISPNVICPLGRLSMKFVMEKFGLESEIDVIGKIHGKVFKGKETIIPFYHPAVALYNPKMRDVLKKDFKILKKYAD
ncbi:MAG: uracil-DNA glycosylase [Candidatus Paceibacterota bacterium]|jgi:DNA polymerase